MKKLIALLPDDLGSLDLSALALKAIEFRIESVENGSGGGSRRVGYTRKVIKHTSVNQEIMKHYTPQGGFTLDLARGWCEKVGYKPASAAPALSRLVADGYVAQLASGRYKFVKQLRAA